jgi:MoaA/NifB/PqqE/SkfB family radical SAM enzyme
MFVEVTDRDVARRVFKETVSRVEMETHSYCNRRCSYCPNVVGDRLGPNQLIPEDIWQTIIGGLEEIEYDELLVLNYYNEPLADRSILARIREARTRLPKARIMIYSNGDYLEPSLIEELADAGLNYLHVSIHLKQGDAYTDRYVLNRIIEVSVRMGIPAQITALKSAQYIVAKVAHRRMEIEVRAINFYHLGTDRGGLIGDIHTAAKRKDSCFFPFAHFVVSYNGLVAPCCHIRSDRPEHEAFIYGNLRDYGSIFQAFTSAPAAAWRRELSSSDEKRSPCDTCSAGVLTNADSVKIVAAAHQRHVLGAPAAAGSS